MQTGSITVPDGGCSNTWLTDLVRSQNTQLVTLEELAELEYEYPTGVHQILDRRTPVVTRDIANAPEFELSFLTDTDEQRLKARAILGNGVPVLLRTPPQDGIGNIYFSVTGWAEQRPFQLATEPTRRFVTQCVQVDRPDPGLFRPLVPISYADVTAGFADYADMTADRGVLRRGHLRGRRRGGCRPLAADGRLRTVTADFLGMLRISHLVASEATIEVPGEEPVGDPRRRRRDHPGRIEPHPPAAAP